MSEQKDIGMLEDYMQRHVESKLEKVSIVGYESLAGPGGVSFLKTSALLDRIVVCCGKLQYMHMNCVKM